MKKFIILLLILVVFLISSCTEKQVDEEIECTKNEECNVGGCSGQVCGPTEQVNNIITTCEYKEIYGCYELTTCGCVEDKCQWADNGEFNSCLDKFS